MFAALYFNTTVYLKKVLFWVNPYDPNRDKLSILGNDYGNNLVANVSAKGVMEIFHPAGDPLNSIDWNKVINMPTYRLNMDVSLILILLSDKYIILIFVIII